MYHIAIFLEHVDLLNSLDGLDIELLERRLQLLVVGAAGLVDLLRLSSRCAFAATVIVSLLLDMCVCFMRGRGIAYCRIDVEGSNIPCGQC